MREHFGAVEDFRGKLRDKKMGLLPVRRNPLILSKAGQISHVTNVRNNSQKSSSREIKEVCLNVDLTHVEHMFRTFLMASFES